jgi:UDP:flavonoid glycosyltransferase YjiC (YdhE family)
MRHVPMIVCPFHGDQAANAERAVEREIAKALNIHEKLDAVQIKNAIIEVITDAR